MGTGDLLNIQPTELKVQCKSFLKLICHATFCLVPKKILKNRREKNLGVMFYAPLV